MIKPILSGTKTTKSSMKSALNIEKKVYQFLKPAADNIKMVWKPAAEKTVNDIRASVKTPINNLKYRAENIVDTVKESPENIKNYVTGLKANARNYADSKIDSLRSSAATAIDNTKDRITSTFRGLKGTGANSSSAESAPTTTKTVHQPTSSSARNRAEKRKEKRLANVIENYKTRMSAAKSEKDFAEIASDNGFEYKKGMSHEEMNKAMRNTIKAKLEEGPTIGDYFHAYHGPGITAATVAGGGLLAFMNSKGQVSNQQLYSDPFA